METQFIKVLVYGGFCLGAGLIGFGLMQLNGETNPNAKFFGKIAFLILVPCIIIFGILAIDAMLTF